MADSSTQDPEPSTSGWDAITAALDKLYPGQEPRHWGTLIPYSLGGPDPLPGLSAYLHEDESGVAHWHFVSFGMSELYEKESEEPDISGWGFEFTFRLKAKAGQTEPPKWPLGFLQN